MSRKKEQEIVTTSTPHVGNYLEHIRDEALHRVNALSTDASNAQHAMQQTIADLEAWRSEIDATIAFLKAIRS
jgi:hypothetical protein